MKLIGVIGEPATGKTTLMRAVLERLGPEYTPFKFGKLLYGRQYPRDLYVLGIYRKGEPFAGTDRLSMAVQPVAIRFIRHVGPKAIVLFEGDRLTRQGFLEVAANNLHLFMLETSYGEKMRRHDARADTQPEQFHKSRATLISRIASAFPVERLRNESPADTEANATAILAKLQR